jgi:glutamine cyclotransferase
LGSSTVVRWLLLVLVLLVLVAGLTALLLLGVPPRVQRTGWGDVGAALSAAPFPLPLASSLTVDESDEWVAVVGGPEWVETGAGVPSAEPSAPAQSVSGTPVYSYRVLRTYPHDPTAFTQGLVYTDGVLYEGTGMYGDSSLRKVDLETGQVLQYRDLSSQYFGEGIVVLSDTIIQLTWRQYVAFVYNRETFSQTGTFTYTTEGWGLTHDGDRLIMSDGSSTLFFRDPQTFSRTGQVQVLDGTTPVARLNELEYIAGEIYANVWLTDRIVRIDPTTGQVTAWIDLTGLRPPGTDVLNGIAYDTVGDRLFVTGKYWPSLFEIELVAPVQIYLPCVVRTEFLTNGARLSDTDSHR